MMENILVVAELFLWFVVGYVSFRFTDWLDERF